MKKIFVITAAFLLTFSLCACKARGEAPPKQKGARENAVVQENPRLPLDGYIEQSEPDSKPDSKPEKDNAPEELVRSMLEAVKTGDKDKIQSFVDYGALFEAQDGHGADWHIGRILGNIKYQILSSDVDDGNASVWVKITNIDMGVVLPEYFNSAMKLEYDNALSDEPVSGAELENEYKNIFNGLVETHKNGLIDRLAEIKVQKTDGEWKIIPGNDLSNMLLGGYFSAKSLAGENVQMSVDAFEQKGQEMQMQPEYPPADDSDFSFDEIDGDIPIPKYDTDD